MSEELPWTQTGRQPTDCEAAEWIAGLWAECVPHTQKGIAAQVARAYLAEHPADDGEPVTEEWLRAVGFNGDSYGSFSKSIQGIGVQGGVTGRWMIYNAADDDSTFIQPMPTRGHVRKLASALGIELKEPSK